MRFATYIVLLVLSACAPATPAAPSITRACVRSFATTLDAWRDVVDRVPEACAFLDAEYDVLVVSASEMPCDEPIGVNQVRTECIRGGVIYLNEDFDDVQLVDASVHGWVHALALCVYGDIDADHLHAPLWEVYRGAESVEIQAQASAEIGECL